jgi:hypothetical protein
VLLRALAEWLCFLRRVDPCKADPVLLPIAVEQRDRVTVSNAHHPAFEPYQPNSRSSKRLE